MNPVYADPDNLNYYFTSAIPLELNVAVLQKKEIQTDFSTVEIAIIGSSHYVNYNNTYLELLTCTDEVFLPEILLTHIRKTTFSYQFQNRQIKYSIESTKVAYSSPGLFKIGEREIINTNPVMIRFFEHNQALTAINYQQKDQAIVIDTWHGYPDYRAIIHTRSSFEIL